MDVETFHQFAGDGLPVDENERKEIDAVVTGTPGEVSSDLLQAIREARRWVEQETVAEVVLGLRPTANIKGGR
jgi:hypothetical protein